MLTAHQEVELQKICICNIHVHMHVYILILKDFREDHENLQPSQCQPTCGYNQKQASWNAAPFLSDLNPTDTKKEVGEQRTALLLRLVGMEKMSQDTPRVPVCSCLALPMAAFCLQQWLQLLIHPKCGFFMLLRTESSPVNLC